MGLNEDFEAAAEEVKTLAGDVVQSEEKLKLYGLYKQATEGDVTGGRPGMFNMKGRYKWDSWEKEKGKTQDQAKEEYIAFVKELMSKYAS